MRNGMLYSSSIHFVLFSSLPRVRFSMMCLCASFASFVRRFPHFLHPHSCICHHIVVGMFPWLFLAVSFPSSHMEVFCLRIVLAIAPVLVHLDILLAVQTSHVLASPGALRRLLRHDLVLLMLSVVDRCPLRRSGSLLRRRRTGCGI